MDTAEVGARDVLNILKKNNIGTKFTSRSTEQMPLQTLPCYPLEVDRHLMGFRLAIRLLI